jgi:predicted RNase H-like HicB family nuclease
MTGDNPMKYTVRLIWSHESKCWRTEYTEIPGLWLEADTYDELIADICNAAPEFIKHNCNYKGPVELIFESKRLERFDMVS